MAFFRFYPSSSSPLADCETLMGSMSLGSDMDTREHDSDLVCAFVKCCPRTVVHAHALQLPLSDIIDLCMLDQAAPGPGDL